MLTKAPFYFTYKINILSLAKKTMTSETSFFFDFQTYCIPYIKNRFLI